ncbi:hypothetical protein E2C01_021111 [Portunus trituberculatus]|uniref:Uncharacterized protein n=1 Tax=Portunus trituberculatus TaxID=210409 RepID=A0A5B7E1M3_PORTR|nr:hypothetical protein [Portunus trituberculatus]
MNTKTRHGMLKGLTEPQHPHYIASEKKYLRSVS